MSRRRPSLSLLEAALLISLLGIVLAVFVPTFLRRVRTNKISEAPELLQELSARTAAYYATSWDSRTHHCLPPRAGPTPEAPSLDPVEVDFYLPEQAGHETWEVLGFQPDRPIRYSYTYTPSRTGCGLTSGDDFGAILFRAEGDLDGDGVRAIFERQATVEASGIVASGPLFVRRRVE